MGRSLQEKVTFSTLLSDGILAVSKFRKWTRTRVREDIGSEMGLGGRAIERWQNEHPPRDPARLETTARYLVHQSGGTLSRDWLEQFLRLGGHEWPDALIRELFPDSSPPPAPPSEAVEFMGRERELQQMLDGIGRKTRLCVIHGLPGVGKYTLAEHYAEARRGVFPGGVVTVEIGPSESSLLAYDSTEARLINRLTTLANGLGKNNLSKQQTLGDKSTAFKALLQARKRRTLLILVNVPTRDELDLFVPQWDSDHTFLVTTPNSNLAAEADLAIALEPFDNPLAADLLAQTIGPTVDRRADEPTLLRIAEYVGGLPLALWAIGKAIGRDAAANHDLEHVTLAEYCDLHLPMDDRLFIDLDERVQKALYLSCYKLLSEPVRRCFAALGAFEGPTFTREAVDAVIAPDGRREVNWLRELTDFSLLATNRYGRPPVGGPRLSLHALARLLARARLPIDYAAEAGHFHDRVAQFYVDLAANHVTDYPLLEVEWPNIQAAMNYLEARQALFQFQRGLEVLARPGLGALGFLETTGRWGDASRWAKRAQELAGGQEDEADQPLFSFIAGVFDLRRGDLMEADEKLAAARTALEAEADADEDRRLLLAQVYQTIGEVRTRLGRGDEALAALDRSQALLEALGTETALQELGYTNIRRGQPLFQSGQGEAAVAAMLRGLAALPQHPTAAHISGAVTLGTIYNYSNRPEEAVVAWDEGLVHAEALGDVRRTADLWRNKTNLQAEYGQMATAAAVQSEWFKKYEEMGDAAGMGEAASNLGLAYLGLNQVERSRHWLDRAMDTGRQHGLMGVQAHAAINLTRWHIHQGDFATATATLRPAEDAPLLRSEAQRLRAEIALHEGQGEAALVAAQEAIKTIRSRADAGSAHRTLGDVLSALGRADEAEAAFNEALAIFGGNRYETALTDHSYAKHLRAVGREEEARDREEAATAALASLGLPLPWVQ